MSVYLFGKDAKLYISATLLDGTNTPAQTTWLEYPPVIDLTGNFTGVSVDTTTREVAATGWTASETILNTGELTFNMPHKKAADAQLQAFIDAWLNKTLIAAVAMNRDKDNLPAGEISEGLAANWSIEMTQQQPLQDRQTWDVTMRVASFPSWYRVTGA